MNLEIIKMPEVVVKTIGEDSIAYCAEKWGQYEKGRLVVSLFSMLVQVCFFKLDFLVYIRQSVEKKVNLIGDGSGTRKYSYIRDIFGEKK